MKQYITLAAFVAAGTASAWAGSLTTTTTTISSGDFAGTYSGGIVKIAPGTQFHSGTFSIFESDSNGEITWGNTFTGTATNIDFGGVSTSDAFWKRFASNQASTYGHTLYIEKSDASININTDFTPYSLGGLIVEGNADVADYSVTLGRGGTIFEIAGAQATGFVANVKANTTLLGNNGIAVNSNATWNIASGKTVTLSSSSGVKFSSGVGMSVSGGGSLVVSKLVFSGNDNWTFDGGLNLANSDKITLSDNSTATANEIGADSGFTGTVTLKNVDGTASVHVGVDLAKYGVSGSKIVLENMGGKNLWLSGGSVSADVELRGNGLTLNNGSGGATTTFTGAITGDGNFTQGANPGGNAIAQVYVFTGDVSGFSGDFIRTKGATDNRQGDRSSRLIFGNGGEGVTGTYTDDNGLLQYKSVSGSGSIEWGQQGGEWGVVYNYSNDVYATNNIVKGALVKQGAGSLTLTGDSSYAGGTTVEAGTLVAASATALGSGTLTVKNGSVFEIATEGLSLAGVTLEEGAKFAIDLSKFDVIEGEALNLVITQAITLGSLSDEALLADVNTQAEAFFDKDASTLGDYEDYVRNWGYDTTAGALTLTLTSIPEPSAFGLLAGLGALALAGARRRKKA
ncbi:MAG: autotransporter-associated beta strand repeat-containing protein [Kiritimatiellae bacterium]|nr:autotransporter-associated beta strand repeat-containing protein [Kiritimatiellia bacterium]